MTPRQFANAVKGYRKEQDTLSKERWIIARKMMWAVLAPNAKNLKEHEILEFPWEEEMIKEFTADEIKAIQEEVEQAKKHFWKEPEHLQN